MDKTQGESKFLAFIKKLVPKKAVSLTAKKARMGWLFVLPFVIRDEFPELELKSV